MGISTLSELFNASKGQIAPRSFILPEPVNPGIGESQDRRTALARTASQALAAPLKIVNGVEQPAISKQPNPVFSSIMSGTRRAGGGLNPEGKYSGFTNAGDLQTAIEGSAISLGRTSTPQSLRAKAEALYNKIDPMYSGATGTPERAFQEQRGGYNSSQMPGVDPNKEYSSEGYVGKIVNPSRQYANQLNDWYKKQALPAENYLESAQQLEATPLSYLAQQIATSAYGMNPDLAAGKFTTLDDRYYAQQRDVESMDEYGMPYAEYKDKTALFDKNQKAIIKQYADTIESTSGYKANALAALTAQTPEQMYASYGVNYTYKDPETKNEVVKNGQAIVQIMREYLYAGELDFARDLADSLGSQDLARILNAMYNLGATRDIRTKETNAIYSG